LSEENIDEAYEALYDVFSHIDDASKVTAAAT